MSEYLHVEKTFLDQLAELGWTVIDQGSGVIPTDPSKSLRDSFRECLLPDVFRSAVRAINTTDGGRTWLTDRQLDELRDQILRQPNRTLLEANEAIQALLFKTQVDTNEVTGEQDPVVKLIDFANQANNQFHAINQFRIDTPGCVKQFIIPDIVLFVNGIPLAVVECKLGSPTCANPMHEAFVQLQRYRNAREATQEIGLKEGEPRLFHTNLLLIRSSGAEADYGTLTSGEEHFYAWKTLWPESDEGLAQKNPQQRLIQGMLGKQNLLRILRTCAVFMDTDSGKRIKVVARYQQFRAAGKIIERLRNGATPMERSGVVWHTQGSGKSLTMVFVARMLRASRDLSDFKILLVNDRVDLEEQLGDTAALIGGKVTVIENTQSLRRNLATDSSDINMVMVHKFQERQETLTPHVAEALGTYLAMPSANTFGVVNASERIILMIDEAHRTQGSDLADNLFEAFPNATRIAFTGTPLITERHGGKRTEQRFGVYIDTYRLMDAVHDGATLQILYEGKTADTALNEKHQFDTKFEDLFRDRSEAELLAIKKKYGATGDILEAEQRIGAIARDLVSHYIDNILPNGFKAQVVCHSKLAAVRYRSAIVEALAERLERERLKAAPDQELIDQIAFLKAVVVISSDGTNEAAYVTQARKQAKAWNAVENFCKPFDRADHDKELTGIAFLIVCDMLITGFDAPIEQVMYIDKKIREHTLLQAIARVNRVSKGKKRGYVVDYIGLANHLTEALTLYAATDEQAELGDGLKNITSELPVLDERYQRLVQFFKAAGVSGVEDFVQGRLAGIEADTAVVHAAVAALKDERLRADFEVYLKKFLMSMDIILPHEAAQPYRVPAKRFGYILSVTKERYKDESLDLGDAGDKVRRLVNEHLISLGINPKVPPVELLAEDFLDQLNRHAGGNDEAKASEMEHAIRKHCTVKFDEDPAFYKTLSEKMERLIDQYQGQWDLLADELEKLRAEAAAGRTVPIEGLDKEATTFYAHVVDLAFGKEGVPVGQAAKIKSLMKNIVELLQETIGIIDFWNNPAEQKRLRGELNKVLLMADIPEVSSSFERLAVEIMKLAKNRHDELLKG
ncbi:MAG: HsdR family type I site-specific deoxyribonuclease [Gallionella sp.]